MGRLKTSYGKAEHVTAASAGFIETVVAAGSPAPMIVAFALVGVALRLTVLRPGPSATAAGAIVMAIGIFGLAALQQIPALHVWLTRPLAAALLVTAALIGASYGRSAVTGDFARHVASPLGRFAVGTWVAGVAVLARVEFLAFPEWRWLAASLGVTAAVVWLAFLPLVLGGLRQILASEDRRRSTGVILLATVSTQSVALVVLALLAPSEPRRWAVLALLCLGYALYGLGAVLIAQRYLRQPRFDWVEDWDSRNTILHGALSITGLTAVTCATLPAAIPIATWLCAAVLLALVEGMEIGWLIARVRVLGWRRGVFTYGVAQWSRNFTFGLPGARRLRGEVSRKAKL